MFLAPVLLLLASASHAERPMVRAELDARQVALELVLRGQVWEQPVLLATRGARSSEWLDYVESARPGLALRPVDLPDDGDLDVEMALAMGRAGLDCALSLEPAAGERWVLTQWGSCSPHPGVLLPARPPSSTVHRVADSFEGDPRSADDLAADLSLVLVDTDGPEDSGERWTLEDGTRYPLSTLRFALHVDDQDTVRRLERERRRRPYAATLLGVAGGTASMVGAIAMLVGFTEAGDAMAYDHIVRGQNVGWAGMVTFGAGQLLLSGIPFHRRSLAHRRVRPDHFYGRSEVERLVGEYNRDLAHELGVGEPEEAAGLGDEGAAHPDETSSLELLEDAP